MIGPTCPVCGWVHGTDEVAAVGRFTLGGPIGYRAQVPGGRLRPTRDEALRDVCDYKAGLR